LSNCNGSQLVPESFLSFYCPLDEETGGGADEVLANSAAWVDKFDLGSGSPEVNFQYAATGCAVVAHLLPHADAPRLMQALADYSAWAWLANETVMQDTRRRRGHVMWSIPLLDGHGSCGPLNRGNPMASWPRMR
jgi:hypothetical protein